MNLPKISIIITVYNSEKYIAETLDSVVNQSYKNLEIICVNDGSIDNSLKILKEYESKDNRLKVFTIENNGQCYASNFGINKCSGEYVKFLDSDDIISSNHIELQYNRIKDSFDEIASCEWGRFYNDDYLSAKFNAEEVWKDLNPLEWLKISELNAMMGAWLWLIPRNILEKSGYWNESLTLNNDFDFSIRILLASKSVRFAKGAKIYYRSGDKGGIYSQSLSDQAVDSAFLTTKLGCSNFLKVEDTKFTRLICANRYQAWVYRIYPFFPEKANKFQNEIDKLGGSDLKYNGGRLFTLVISIFGIKSALKLKRFIYRLGYKPTKPKH